MGRFVGGDVVVIPFPFSDLSGDKKRPALVVAPLNGDDVILCQITSKQKQDGYAIPLINTDFSNGSLRQDSNIRPNRLFTADSHKVLSCAGRISLPKLDEVREKICEIIYR